MKEFLLALFLGRVIALTSAPVDISPARPLELATSAEAITSGASLQLDIPMLTASIHRNGWAISPELIADWRDVVPEGSVTAVLRDRNGGSVTLTDNGVSVSRGTARLILANSAGVPTDVEFIKVTISATVDLKQVRVYWKNYSN